MSCSGVNCDSNYTPSGLVFQSNPGRYGLCSAIWNPEKRQFRQANNTEIKKCCLETSKKIAKKCMEDCNQSYGPKEEKGNYKDYIKCRKECARMILSAENICSLSQPKLHRGDSPILGCMSSIGCGKYPHYDQTCIRDNKNSIINCCNRNCIPTSTVSCTDHCNMKYYDLAGESKNPLLNIYDEFPESSLIDFNINDSIKGDKSWIWYLSGVGIAIIVVIIVIWIINKKK